MSQTRAGAAVVGGRQRRWWYAQDAEKLEGWAKGLSGPADLKPDAGGDEVQQKLAGIAEKAAAGKFLYTKFFAIGLFRRACSAIHH